MVDLCSSFRLGKYLADFRDFLRRQPDTFEVYGDVVVLIDGTKSNKETANSKEVLKQKPKHHATHAPRKVRKYVAEYDFTLERFCA